ncbi:MAG: DUF3316 domain-containing protein [Paraprevotella sp.]|nr:DUF3316 domain-containing protein [Paraprevotella sp.]
MGILLFPVSGQAQEEESPLPENRYTTHATLFGIGHSNLYETYLSPSAYTGPQLSVLHETLRKTHWLDGRITTQSVLDGFFSYASNKAGNSNEMGGKINYAIGWHYNWLIAGKLRLMAGGDVHGGLGAIYNTRNSNNPVQAKAEADIGASLIAIYPFYIKKVPFTVRYQIGVPLIGAMFSPHYGQSYYEMSLGNYDHNICFTYPGNAPSMRHFLTLDFPIAGFTFRAGYFCDIRQSRVNGLRSHIWNHSFMLGYVKHFSFVKRKEPQHHSFIL